MAKGLVFGCCKCVLAAAAVPLAVIVAVMLEKPHITEVSLEGSEPSSAPAQEATAGAGDASGQADPVEDFGAATAQMGSGTMFDRIAFVYDSTNKWMSLGLDQHWRKTLMQDCMRLERDDRVLDLATGTADVGLLAGQGLRQLNAGGAPKADAVLGVDPSAEMLRRGVSKVEKTGLEGVVRLVKGDAQNLTQVRGVDAAGTLSDPTTGVASGSIDKISMAFGIRNVPDRSLALREMRRVLRRRESSRVCILEFSLPDGKTFLSGVAKTFIKHIVPAIGKVATLGSGGVEYQYLERSILKFPPPLEFAASMAREGLPVRTITSFAFGAVQLYAAAPAPASGGTP